MRAILKRIGPSVVVAIVCFVAGFILASQTTKVNAQSEPESLVYLWGNDINEKCAIDVYRDVHTGNIIYVNRYTGSISVGREH